MALQQIESLECTSALVAIVVLYRVYDRICQQQSCCRYLWTGLEQGLRTVGFMSYKVILQTHACQHLASRCFVTTPARMMRAKGLTFLVKVF